MPLSFGFAKSNTTKTKRKLIPSAIPTDGLQVYLDAGDPNSYPGAGNTWFDLSGNGRHSTLYNSVTHTKNSGGGALQFTTGNTGNKETSSYILTQVPNLSSSNHTIIAASRYTDRSNNRGRLITGNTNNWLLGHWGNSTEKFFAEGAVSSATTGVNPNDIMWRIYTATGDITNDSWGLYVNNNQIALNNSGSQGPNGLALGGAQGLYYEPSQGEIAFLLVWNRVLTAAERTAVYDYFKNRFIVQDSSLKLHLDASRSDSYSGSGTTWSDLSPSGNNVTLNTTPTYSDGKLTFAESTYGTVANGSSIIASSPYTKSVWVKFNNLNGFKNLISGNDSSSHAFWAPASWDGRTNKVLAGHNGTWTLIQSSQTLETQKWYNLTLTFSTTNGFKLYINGQLEATNSAATTNFNHSGGPLYIGAYAVLNNGFNGQLASALVYNKELSASEIAQNYNASKAQFYTDQFPASISNLEMWLKADAGVLDANNAVISTDNTAITTWLDQTSNNRHLTQTTNASYKPTYRSAANGVNNLPAISFDGGDGLSYDWTNFNTSTPYTIFTVANYSSFGDLTLHTHGFNPYTGYQGDFHRLLNSGGRKIRTNASASFPETGDVMPASGTVLLTFQHSGVSGTAGTYTARLNGNQIYTASITRPSSIYRTLMTLGASYINQSTTPGMDPFQGFNGKICEHLYFSRILNQKEINMVEAYLTAKWNVNPLSVVTDNLVLHLDAANTYSYSGAQNSSNTWQDLSGLGHNATLNNGAFFDTLAEGCIKFDGSNDNATLVTTSSLKPTTAVTVETWVYVDALPNGISMVVECPTASTHSDPYIEYGLLLMQSNRTIHTRINGVGAGDSSANAYTVGAWNHLAMTWTNGVVKYYSNGVLIGTTNPGVTTITYENPSVNVRLASNASNGERLNGKIAQVRIYSSALSDSEILRNFNATKKRFNK